MGKHTVCHLWQRLTLRKSTLKNWSLKQADIYHNNLVAAFNGLASGAKQGRYIGVLPDFQKYLCGSHVIYFLDYPDHLDVIRVLHQRHASWYGAFLLQILPLSLIPIMA